MPKTKISEFSETPGDNTDINGINIDEGCSPANVNNAIRQLMADLKEFQAGTVASNQLAIAGGGTGATTAADARTNLGLGTMATQAASNVAITGGSIAGITDLALADGGTGASTAADARTNLGLGTIATQAASNVAITGGSVTGITDLALADGGTGASTAADARTNLGLGSLATASTINNSNWSGTALAVANGGTGATDAGTARTNLGLGSIATQASNNVSITGGAISGITDLAVADGGTGASSAANARTNLGLVIGTDVPSPTGTGASGTWAISISGNAGSANSVAWSNVSSKPTLATYVGQYDTGYLGDGANGDKTYDIAYSSVGSPSSVPLVKVDFDYWVYYGGGGYACTVTLKSVGWYNSNPASNSTVLRIVMNINGSGQSWPYNFVFKIYN